MRPKERLLRRGKIPNEEKEIRKALEEWSDRLSRWTEAFTALVVAGLIVEYLPEITYFLAMRVGSEVSRHAEQLRQFGGFLVIVGVVGELWIEVRASRVETDLRGEYNSTIEATRERAARAEQAAAEADLKRIKLESTLVRRTVRRSLEPQEEVELVGDLSKHAGQRCSILMSMGRTSEQISFATQLKRIVESAGWLHENLHMQDPEVHRGVRILLPPNFAADAAYTLSMELAKLQISSQLSNHVALTIPLIVIWVGVL
jgi:uncharacterized protein YjeT (DUF2065 family)